MSGDGVRYPPSTIRHALLTDHRPPTTGHWDVGCQEMASDIRHPPSDMPSSPTTDH